LIERQQMKHRSFLPFALVAVAVAAAPVPGAKHPSSEDLPKPVAWQLDQRATLSADYIAEGPPSGAAVTPANGRTGPFPGQVIPGFSGVIDNGDGTLWGLPDNGFGAKDNSADFLLRLYLIEPDWETADGGSGDIDVLDHISLRDPDHHLPFAIVNEETDERLLTGADFDIESVVQARDGSLWIGDEFGPFLLHVDADGVVLEAPVPFVDGKSPQNPTLAEGEAPTVNRSRGFEAMAASRSGRFLYPIVEGQLANDDQPRRRWIYQFDTRKGAYTGKRWAYETDSDANVIGDAVMIGSQRMLVIERDDFDGAKAVTKKVFEIRLDRKDARGYVRKKLAADLLYIDNPAGIPADGGDAFGVGSPFSFPMQSVETVVMMRDGRLLIANDNNYPGNAARAPGTPDDTELIVISPVREFDASDPGVLVLGHRGASGYRPEHTLAAYELAIRQCADYIEPDVVSTKDGVLVARHENEISGTTDIAARPEFADRKATKVIDGVEVTGWFTEDLTLAELKTLRAVERLPDVRPANMEFDGRFDVPTLDEVMRLAATYRTCDGNEVGIYPETKHPTYFDSIGLSLEEPLLDLLDRYGYDDEEAKVFVQSFETGNLRELDEETDVRLVQLINCKDAPYDLVAAGDPTTYADLVTADGLAEVATYADGVGLCKDLMIPRTAEGALGEPTTAVADAQVAGLEVHGWTFRAENNFLPADLRSSDDVTAFGNLAAEIEAFVALGIDGLFSDHPDLAAAAVNSH
jgi:glycerophosphoryl diester phosphodiesterase